MNGLPFSITRYLCGQWTDRTIFIYVLINEQGFVTDWSDNISPFYGLELNNQQPAYEQLIFLQGYLPYKETSPLILDSVNFDTGRSADVHIIPAEDNEICVLLFDVTESTKLRQQLQQKGNELSLLYEQEKRSMSALKKNYKILQHQKELLEDSNRAKNKFLYHINHDLKNPLNGISGFLQLLQMCGKPLDEEQKSYIEEIKNSSNYMLDLVNELLDIAKIESGHINIKPELLIPTTIINESINSLRPIAEKNNIFIINRISSNIPPLWIELLRFRQIITNFVSNSIKYNRNNGCIIIDSYIIKGSTLRITIKDTGFGIKPSQLEKIFDPFHTEIDSAGIGLNVCKQLVELMQGSVGVYSDIDLGSLFWIELPLEKELDIQKTPSKNTQHKALYLDNDEMNANLMSNLISQCSECDLQVATNVNEMLNILDKQSISVIFINTESFKQKYLQILHNLRLHSTAKKIPVVAIFDIDNDALEINTAMQAGFHDYMIKPFDFNFTLDFFERLKSV